jgi:hypothetical protein
MKGIGTINIIKTKTVVTLQYYKQVTPRINKITQIEDIPFLEENSVLLLEKSKIFGEGLKILFTKVDLTHPVFNNDFSHIQYILLGILCLGLIISLLILAYFLISYLLIYIFGFFRFAFLYLTKRIKKYNN